jgi:L-ascorbate metabolism protein UlaG (beta-lactamase superfamily)
VKKDFIENIKMSHMKQIYLLISFIFMTGSLFSQTMPPSDKLTGSAGDIELYFVGHGTLMFKVNNFVIHIDPVRSSGDYTNMPKADLILVTHEHGDHLDTALVNRLRKEGTVMYANSKSAEQVKWAETMKPGDIRKVKNITIEAVFAYNIKNVRPDGQPYHPKGQGNGYVITIGDKRIYVAGDTENIPEMKDLKNIDVAFLPMNLPYTMTPEMVASAARSFKPAVLYPYHYGDTKTDEIVKLLTGSGIEVRIRNLK